MTLVLCPSALRRLLGGVNLVAVSGLLRHASTRMSERYLHVTRANLRAPVEAGRSQPGGGKTRTHVDALLQSVDLHAPAKTAEQEPN